MVGRALFDDRIGEATRAIVDVDDSLARDRASAERGEPGVALQARVEHEPPGQGVWMTPTSRMAF